MRRLEAWRAPQLTWQGVVPNAPLVFCIFSASPLRLITDKCRHYFLSPLPYLSQLLAAFNVTLSLPFYFTIEYCSTRVCKRNLLKTAIWSSTQLTAITICSSLSHQKTPWGPCANFFKNLLFISVQWRTFFFILISNYKVGLVLNILSPLAPLFTLFKLFCLSESTLTYTLIHCSSFEQKLVLHVVCAKFQLFV